MKKYKVGDIVPLKRNISVCHNYFNYGVTKVRIIYQSSDDNYNTCPVDGKCPKKYTQLVLLSEMEPPYTKSPLYKVINKE